MVDNWIHVSWQLNQMSIKTRLWTDVCAQWNVWWVSMFMETSGTRQSSLQINTLVEKCRWKFPVLPNHERANHTHVRVIIKSIFNYMSFTLAL
jgi:hypothetical protein